MRRYVGKRWKRKNVLVSEFPSRVSGSSPLGGRERTFSRVGVLPLECWIFFSRLLSATDLHRVCHRASAKGWQRNSAHSSGPRRSSEIFTHFACHWSFHHINMNSFYESFYPRISAAMPLGMNHQYLLCKLLFSGCTMAFGKDDLDRREWRRKTFNKIMFIRWWRKTEIRPVKTCALPAQSARATRSNGKLKMYWNTFSHQNRFCHHFHFHWLCQMQFAMQPMRTAKLFQNKMCAMWPAVPPATRAFLILLMTELRQ